MKRNKHSLLALALVSASGTLLSLALGSNAEAATIPVPEAGRIHLLDPADVDPYNANIVESAQKRVAYVGDFHDNEQNLFEFEQLLRDVEDKPKVVLLENLRDINTFTEDELQQMEAAGLAPEGYPFNLSEEQLGSLLEYWWGFEVPAEEVQGLSRILQYCEDNSIRVKGLDSGLDSFSHLPDKTARLRERVSYQVQARWGNRVFEAMRDVDAEAGEYGLIFAGADHGNALRWWNVMPEVPVYEFEFDNEVEGDGQRGSYRISPTRNCTPFQPNP